MQLNEPTRIQDRNKYNFSVEPNFSVEAYIPKTKLIFGVGFAHSFSKISIFVGGEPLFYRNEGFSKIHLNNNHLKTDFYFRHPFISGKRLTVSGALGAFIGFPNFLKKTASIIEGISYTNAFGSNYELHYIIQRSNYRNSAGISAGVSTDIKLSKVLSLTVDSRFRMGLVQSVAYLYLFRRFILTILRIHFMINLKPFSPIVDFLII